MVPLLGMEVLSGRHPEKPPAETIGQSTGHRWRGPTTQHRASARQQAWYVRAWQLKSSTLDQTPASVSSTRNHISVKETQLADPPCLEPFFPRRVPRLATHLVSYPVQHLLSSPRPACGCLLAPIAHQTQRRLRCSPTSRCSRKGCRPGCGWAPVPGPRMMDRGEREGLLNTWRAQGGQ